jgi:ligand-binding SRPBCC domain-containing protein
MPKVIIETTIAAPIERCFDLARNIDFHSECYRKSHERAVAGKTSGFISLGEHVTFRMREFGVQYTISVEITAFRRPFHFRDEQTSGIFKRFAHDHHFERRAAGTLMTDVFDFEPPYGIVGRAFSAILLTRHVRASLTCRNAVLKEAAESEHWKAFFPSPLREDAEPLLG